MNIGIDLGTTNSVVAYIDDNGQAQIVNNAEGGRTTPSVVLFEEDTVIVGEVAKNNAVLNPYSTVQFVKRQMGNVKYSFANEEGNSFSAEEILCANKIILFIQRYYLKSNSMFCIKSLPLV